MEDPKTIDNEDKVVSLKSKYRKLIPIHLKEDKNYHVNHPYKETKVLRKLNERSELVKDQNENTSKI